MKRGSYIVYSFLIADKDKQKVLVDKITNKMVDLIKEQRRGYHIFSNLSSFLNYSNNYIKNRMSDVINDMNLLQAEEKEQAINKLHIIFNKIGDKLKEKLETKLASNDTGKGIKDRDLMSDTGGTEKYRKTPNFKPPRDENKNRYKDKKLTKDMRRDLARDTINDPDLKKD